PSARPAEEARAPGGAPPPLPRRSHRRDRSAEAPRPAEPAPAPLRSAHQAQSFMARFQAGTATGRSAARPDPRPAAPHSHQQASPRPPQRPGESDDHQS
ncbi:hypothetical protein ACFRKE_25715, partial [Kitasatospora indigofera]